MSLSLFENSDEELHERELLVISWRFQRGYKINPRQMLGTADIFLA